jgi:hypothetical protein
MEVVVAYSEILSRHLPEETEENTAEASVRIVSVSPGIRTGHLPNTRQEH